MEHFIAWYFIISVLENGGHWLSNREEKLTSLISYNPES